MEATYIYLGSYAMNWNDTTSNYELDFSIPDNCNYRSTGSNGLFCVDISLDSGQSQPSSNFVSFKESYAAYSGSLVVAFDQPTGGTKKSKKPVITITL